MNGIVLLAKQKGLTSFSSLGVVKKSLNTKKVGHTGTLDSFAQGLLVVCAGSLTRLAGCITEFDKSYKAVIKFGEETDTLEYTGEIVRTGELPAKEKVIDAVKHFTGEQNQIPPLFSAIHVDGKRASDLARKGKSAEIPSRKITVYKAEIMDFLCNEENKVIACMVDFTVSKGTYIRSLARDIGDYCESAGHLIGLCRTRVGNFKIEDAAGYEFLDDFSIKTALADSENFKNGKMEEANPRKHDIELKVQIPERLKSFDKETAALCGFNSVSIKNQEYDFAFRNGKPVWYKWFNENLFETKTENVAVFNSDGSFAGLIHRVNEKKFGYSFVVN